MRQNRYYQIFLLMCNWVGGFGFGLDIGVHDFKFSDTGWIWSLRKKLGSNPIANFHIHTPLVWCPSVHRRYLLRAWRCWTGYVQDFTSGLWWSDSDVWQTWRSSSTATGERKLCPWSAPLSLDPKSNTFLDAKAIQPLLDLTNSAIVGTECSVARQYFASVTGGNDKKMTASKVISEHHSVLKAMPSVLHALKLSVTLGVSSAMC